MNVATTEIGAAPRVTASVIAWNDRAHLTRCLASLRAQTYRNIRIIVVDNASTDGSAEAASRVCPEATVLQVERNLGYAGAHNLSFGLSEDPYFLVLNADVTLAPDYVARLVSIMEGDGSLGSVSGKLLRAPDGSQATPPEPAHRPEIGQAVLDSAGITQDWRGRFRDLGAGLPDDGAPVEGEVFGVCGAAALYRREAVLDAVPESGSGGRPFDSAFFAYYEDADLAWALRRRGWRAGIACRAIARHVRGGSGAGARRVERLLHRNALWVLVKHATLRDLVHIAPGWLTYELFKAFQSVTYKPWLLRSQQERLASLRGMLARRRALRANEQRLEKKAAAPLQAFERGIRDAQAARYDALTDGPYHEQVETPACLERLGARPGERIVDLGCGTGRLLAPIRDQGARIVGADFSLASLAHAREKAPGALLVQADLTRLPFRDGVFDRAVSHQVLHHLPDPNGRREVLAEAARVLGKEGELVLTAYNDALVKRVSSPREGRHPGGIFYHRFRFQELRRLFAEGFELIEAAGIRHVPARSVGERLFTRRAFRWLPRFDRWLEGTALSRPIAHLLIVRGRKRARANDPDIGGMEEGS